MRQIQATRPEMPSYEEYVAEIRDIFETRWLTNNGPKVQRLQKLLTERIGRNVELFVNGHSTLVLAIQAMAFPKGGEVLTSPFTFASTTNAIVQCDLTPVFCDIDDTYNIDVNSLARNVTSETCAIVAPHIFGIPCHVEEINALAQRHGLKVIYDAAQAFGTKVDGVDIGCFGDATMFSFHAIKVFNSIEGGAVVCQDGSVNRYLVEGRNFGLLLEDKEDAEFPSGNAKMDEFRAAMGIVNLAHVDAHIAARKKLAERYIEALSEIPGISTYPYAPNIAYNYAYFPIQVDKEVYGLSRDELHARLEAEGIGTRRLYAKLTCDFMAYKDKDYRCDVAHARELSEVCLDLPLYSALNENDINFISDVIKCNKY